MPIDGWMGRKSLKWLAKQAKQHKRIIEVGAWKGRSTATMAAATKGTIWAVDHWEGKQDDPQQAKLYAEDLSSAESEFRHNLRGHIESGRVVVVKLGSRAAASDLMSFHGPTFDMVFIDADHSYEGAAGDIAAYEPLLAPGGLFAGHDIHWPGVRRAVVERYGDTFRFGPGSIWYVPK